MSVAQTAITTFALIWAIGAYILQMYGAYTAQQSNLHDSTGASGHEVDAGYVFGSSAMNIFITLYLLYYIYAIRYDKHGDVFKVVSTAILLIGLALDIFLSVYIVQLTPTTIKKEVYQSYDWLYILGTVNFLVRIFLLIQFQCSDVLARRFIKPAAVEQPRKQILPGNTGPRPDRGPNPFVKNEEGGRRRRRR
jgi:hypothetical protein